MYTKIVAIGTSKGIRLPKCLFDKYHFEDVIEVVDTGNGLLLRPVKQPRVGWETSIDSSQNLLAEMLSSEWDDKEWEW